MRSRSPYAHAPNRSSLTECGLSRKTRLNMGPRSSLASPGGNLAALPAPNLPNLPAMPGLGLLGRIFVGSLPWGSIPEPQADRVW